MKPKPHLSLYGWCLICRCQHAPDHWVWIRRDRHRDLEAARWAGR